MLRNWISLFALLALLPACDGVGTEPDCSTEQALCADAGTGDGDGDGDNGDGDGDGDDAGVVDAGDGDGDVEPIEATESYEAEVEFGWIAAGQPTEERLTELVNLGARILSIRPANEDPFDEQGLIEGLGGTFIRYPTTAADYNSVSFREAMYDLYDEQIELGGPVYLHCASSNRVGASWALYHAERLGVRDSDALEIGRNAGLASLEAMVIAILETN